MQAKSRTSRRTFEVKTLKITVRSEKLVSTIRTNAVPKQSRKQSTRRVDLHEIHNLRLKTRAFNLTDNVVMVKSIQQCF